MAHPSLAAALILLSSLAGRTAAAAPDRVVELPSQAGPALRLTVRVPDAAPGARLPVIYLADGARDLAAVDAAARGLARRGEMPEAIVVAVERAEAGATPAAAAGSAAASAPPAVEAALAREVAPWVEGNHPAAALRIVAGRGPAGAAPEGWRALPLAGAAAPEVTAAAVAGLRGIFEGWGMPVARGDVGPHGGAAAVEAHYRALSARFGWEVPPPEPALRLAGLQQARDGDAAGALRTLERNASLHAAVPAAHGVLGQAYEAGGRPGDARREYQSAWELARKAKDPRAADYEKAYQRAVAEAERAFSGTCSSPPSRLTTPGR
ncbi:alpha/beta hydrolase-fold protein [Anaeromyxobacter sp. PSR-1]|uniref:alpha/beta hydrolase-fold protein n=1 Tax=unclassified Anaeromyxobacter TaxID=2620896 RepID=UPI0005E9B811|nr:alpha/beta hydrolase-fold protein [Anaeromyxobacter sp. PSR-1]GAO04645.1 putative esterase [Anaeromyxobacter sp. PSR-1]